MKHLGYRHSSCGFTLIEILLAMLLGMFLMGGLLKIFTNSKQLFRTQEALAAMQENGRFALEQLSKDIRMSGFVGCNSQAVVTNTLKTPTGFLYRFDRPLEGFESVSNETGSSWLPTGDSPQVTSPSTGSDIVVIRHVDDTGFTVSAQNLSTDGLTLDAATTVTALKDAGFLTSAGANNCALAIVSNCLTGAVFQVTGIAGNVLAHSTGGSCVPQNTTNDLSNKYAGGQVYAISTIRYYVSLNPSKRPALYTKKNSQPAEEIVEGIEQIQALYGIDTNVPADGTPNFYVTADKVTDWHQVAGIRISLLVASADDNLTNKPVNYTYNGVSQKSRDRRLRKVFTSTISLRNRVQ